MYRLFGFIKEISLKKQRHLNVSKCSNLNSTVIIVHIVIVQKLKNSSVFVLSYSNLNVGFNRPRAHIDRFIRCCSVQI